MLYAVRNLIPSRGFVTEAKGFADQAAALAYLAKLAASVGLTVIREIDSDHPECVDVLLCGTDYAMQYAVEPETYA